MMSTRAYMQTRVKAALETWWMHHNNEVDLGIFAERPQNTSDFNPQDGDINQKFTLDLSWNGHTFTITSLPGVNDSSYPPQKKSFAMVYYMGENKINK